MNLFSSRGPTRGVWVDPATSIGYPDNVLKPDLVAPGNKVLGASATQASTSTPTKNTLATLFPLLETAVPTPTIAAIHAATALLGRTLALQQGHLRVQTA